MKIPEFIAVGTLNVNTFLPLILFAFVFGSFVVWFEGRKDGFDFERIFDLMFSSTFGSFLCAKLFILLPVLHFIDIQVNSVSFIGFVVGFLLPIFYLTKKWRWSVYRILDILSVALAFPLMFLSMYQYLVFGEQEALFAFVSWVVTLLIVYKIRISKAKSGYAFALFTMLASVVAYLFIFNFDSLLFLGSLFTIGLVIILLRNKKDMANANLPLDFFNKLRSRLVAKDKSLKKQENLLTAEDAYLAPGRATDNADPLDEAALEDNQKELTDIRKDAVKNMQVGVKKALEKMKTGKYGVCEVCEKPIDKARLEAFPEARTCVEHMNETTK